MIESEAGKQVVWRRGERLERGREREGWRESDVCLL